MATFCGTSPCEGLMAARAHGRWLKDKTPNEQAITHVILVAVPTGPEMHVIEYCPFCGTKLDSRRAKNHAEFMPKRALPGRAAQPKS